ncbi:hypothetical protein J4447_01960 [Candidatus Pacearchaeota archaeon]|nr:hypothetical protein [Candidatus Pacearchaeota archaeon]
MKLQNSISPDVKEIVLARLDVMPQNYKLSVGNQGAFTKEQLIKHVKEGDSVGIQVVEMQLSFIKALTTGKLMNILNSNE